jgi:DivIVA domain-containing protein
MSSTELDLPVLVTPEQIRRREFVTTRRGYDVGQVRDYLEQLSRQLEQMETMLRSAKLQADAAERAQAGPRPDPYQRLSERFAEVLRTTDREADRIRREAKEEADRVLREARTDADRIRLDAQSRAEQAREDAERTVREARSHADRTIAGLATRRDALVEQLAAMQDRLIGVAHELEAAIERPEDDAALLASLEAAAADASMGDPTDPAPADREVPPVDPSATMIDVEQTERTVEELWASADPDDLRIPEIPEIPALELDWDEGQQD